MKRIGLLGGMSWESSAEYYRLINEATHDRLGGLHSDDRRGGAVEHQRGVTASPGLYFLGVPSRHTRGSALVGWVKDDAAHLSGQIGFCTLTCAAEFAAHPERFIT